MTKQGREGMGSASAHAKKIAGTSACPSIVGGGPTYGRPRGNNARRKRDTM